MMVNQLNCIYQIKYNSFFKEKYRIISIGIFKKGIRPEWESEYNEGGKIFIMEYLIQYNSDNTSNFLKDLSKGWTKLVLSVIGEIFNCSEYVYFY